MLLTEVGRREGIEVTQQDMQQALIRQTAMYPGREAQVVRHYQENPEELRQLTSPIMEDRVVDRILEQVAFEDRPANLEEFLKAEDATVEEADADTEPDTATHFTRVAMHMVRSRYDKGGTGDDSGEAPADGPAEQ